MSLKFLVSSKDSGIYKIKYEELLSFEDPVHEYL